MNLSYRTRQTLKHMAFIAVIFLLIAALVWLCWFVWLKRYVVYTREEGAKIDFSLSDYGQGQAAVPPPEETVSIYYNEGDDAINTGRDLTQLTGYYVNREMLIAGTDQVLQQVRNLERDTPIMLEVKSAVGNFFYSSAVAEYRDSKVDPLAVDQLIKELKKSGYYLIAKLPALRDRQYGLHHVDDGIFDTRGAYLYRDDGGCYWLNPAKQGTLTYIISIVSELKELGFNEVVFDYFDFPETDKMRFNGDKTEALQTAARTLMTSCGTGNFTVSFVQKPGFQLPEGKTRLYIKDAVAADAQTIAQESGIADPKIGLVFLTEFHDTRFDEFGVLRPLDAAF